MSLQIRRSEWFLADLEHYAAWYLSEAGWEVGERYLKAVTATVERLAKMPGLGKPTRFSNPLLKGIRSFPVERPFDKHLIFYRNDELTLYIERAVHGARDLARRLSEPPQA